MIDPSRCTRIVAVAALAACGGAGEDAGSPRTEPEPTVRWEVEQGLADRVAWVEGFDGPEAVRYDPDQDVWFVANFGGDGDMRDANGYVSRLSAGPARIEELRFAVGTADRPLHAPRGMVLTGDTLWVTDIDGLHAFDRRTGSHLGFVDLTGLEPGFLNDVAKGPDGALYVTDTGRSAVYRVAGGVAAVAIEGAELGGPNGITLDEARGAMVLLPWEPDHWVRLWRPGEDDSQPLGPRTPGRLDGVEAIDRRLLLASQTDSSLHLLDGAGSRRVIRTGGAPADIGVDTRRRRVAVPYIGLGRVDIWQLPPA